MIDYTQFCSPIDTGQTKEVIKIEIFILLQLGCNGLSVSRKESGRLEIACSPPAEPPERFQDFFF